MNDSSSQTQPDSIPPPLESLEGKPEPILTEPPPNPLGGSTLIVDGSNPAHYARPSLALQDAGPEDQVFIQPGVYEDRIFVGDKPIHLFGSRTESGENFLQAKWPNLSTRRS